MIKNGKQVLIHLHDEYELIYVGYRWIMHKWSFVIAGTDNHIHYGEKIKFLDTEMTVTFTLRKDKHNADAGQHKTETFIEAWII